MADDLVDEFLYDDDTKVYWVQLGTTIVSGIILAMMSGVIATLVAIRKTVTGAVDGITYWISQRIIPLFGRFPERIMGEAISPGATGDLSIFGLAGGMAAVLASYYVFAWGVSKAAWQ